MISQKHLTVGQQTFNIRIDFCVWVLEVEGLQTPPFVYHKKGSNALQAEGFTAEAWQEWMCRVVSTEDLRLTIIKEPEAWIKLMLESQFSNHTDPSKLSTLRASLEKEVNLTISECQKILERIGTFSDNSTPPDVWTGKPGIRELLKKMWQDYLKIQGQRRAKKERDSDYIQSLMDLHDELQQFYPNLKYLEVYQVNYPTPIEYIVPPAAIIVSLANLSMGSESYCQSILRAAEKLAALNAAS